jgi:hypothetical protein
MVGVRGRSIAPFDNPGIRRRWLVRFTSRPHYLWEKIPEYQPNGKLDDPRAILQAFKDRTSSVPFSFPPFAAVHLFCSEHCSQTLSQHFSCYGRPSSAPIPPIKRKKSLFPKSNLLLISLWKEIFIWHETVQFGTEELALRQNLLLPTWRQKNYHLLQYVEFIAHIMILWSILVTSITVYHTWLKISAFWPVPPCHWASGSSCIAWGITIVCNVRIACPTTQHYNLQNLISSAKPCENQVWQFT